MPTRRMPTSEGMNVSALPHARTLLALSLVVAGGTILGGCGTPAVIKPSATPLPGLKQDIRAAQNAVAKTEHEAQSDASSSVGGP